MMQHETILQHGDIGNKGERYALNWHLLNYGSYKKDFPDEDEYKEMFLFTFKEYHPIKGFRGTEFDITYETSEDMIDDGWAVD